MYSEFQLETFRSGGVWLGQEFPLAVHRHALLAQY